MYFVRVLTSSMCCCSLSISESSSLTGLVFPCCLACWLAHAECILDIQLSCSIWVGACHNIINSKIYQYSKLFLTTFRYTIEIEQKSKLKNPAQASPWIPNFTKGGMTLGVKLTLRLSVYPICYLHYSGFLSGYSIREPDSHGLCNTQNHCFQFIHICSRTCNLHEYYKTYNLCNLYISNLYYKQLYYKIYYRGIPGIDKRRRMLS